MEFGYVTLSDGKYPDNPETGEAFLQKTFDQAVCAEWIGMHPAWIGEHHFNQRGCVPVPSVFTATGHAAGSRQQAIRRKRRI